MLQATVHKKRSLPIWSPLNEQDIEADTIFMLDPVAEQSKTPGVDGMILSAMASGENLSNTTKISVVSGKFTSGKHNRKGIKSNDATNGWLWMLPDGVLPTSEFTIEFWAKADANWSAYTTSQPLFCVGDRVTSSARVNFSIGNATIFLALAHNHGDGAGNPTVSTSITYSLSGGNDLAGSTWQHVAVTYKNQALKLYINGNLRSPTAGTSTGLVPPKVWGTRGRYDGLSILGYTSGSTPYGTATSASHFTISDFRISRLARTPNQTVLPSSTTLVTVQTSSLTGDTIQQKLRGGLQVVTGASAQAVIGDKLSIIRSDKLINTTPIVAGSPNGTHPTAGHSGLYSYDWQVVDRTLDYTCTTMGLEAYVSIDSTPQILGGSSAPYSGSALTSNPSDWGSFNTSVPTDTIAFATIVKDLVYHLIVEKNYNIKYIGFWNEPSGTSFWTGTLAQYKSLYGLVAPAIKSIDPSLKVGAFEDGFDPTASTNWLSSIISYCATNAVPLDFLSLHYYGSGLTELYQFKAMASSYATASNLGYMPELMVGEMCYGGFADLYNDGIEPFKHYHYQVNDWSAAWLASSLIAMQSLGYIMNIFTKPIGNNPGDTGYNSSGLITNSPLQPWANLNVYDMWSRLGDNIVTSSVSGDPGVAAVASVDGNGKTTVLISSLHYRGSDFPINVYVPGISDSASVTHYVIDSGHSNYFDTNDSLHASLESISPPSVKNGYMNFPAKARSVHLLVIQ